MDTKKTRLIGVKEIRETYGIGRLMAQLIIRALPHIKIGRRRLVFAGDLEEFLKQAKESGLDISEFVRRATKRGGVKAQGDEE